MRLASGCWRIFGVISVTRLNEGILKLSEARIGVVSCDEMCCGAVWGVGMH